MLSKRDIKALDGLELTSPKGWQDELTYRKGELVISAGGGEHYKPITLDRILAEIEARKWHYEFYSKASIYISNYGIKIHQGDERTEREFNSKVAVECALRALAEVVRREVKR